VGAHARRARPQAEAARRGVRARNGRADADLGALVEWSDNGGFKRFDFSDDGTRGDWEPWILYVALIWGLVVGIMALKAYFDRPATEAEIDREVTRLKSRG
jgi:hypothetical protein